ncbi:MAG: DUF308 domain-containing protein [Eubacterium sp.]
MNLLKNITPVVWILVAISVLISGLILVFDTTLAWGIIELVIAGLVILVGIMYLFSIFIKTTERKLKVFGLGVLCVLGGVALLTFPQFIKGTFGLVAGILGILVGALVFLNALKLRADGASYIFTGLTALIYIGFGITMAFAEPGGRLFGLIFGFYLIVFSFNIFGDAFVSLMGSNDEAKKIKKHVRIPLPTIIAAFLPMKMLRKINKLVEEDPEELLLISDKSKKLSPDMEIYIHTREGLIPGMGHVDICVGDIVYSYGNYDDSTWKLGGFFADGVMVEMSREDHIQQALDVEKKILMVYGLALKDEQKNAVLERIDEIKNDLVPWKPLSQQCENNEIEGKPEDFTDVSSQLYNATKACFYKFKQGNPFKTYYAVGTNCVKLADTVVGKTGIDLLRVNGIITPGTYLDYLDSLFERGDSIVVTRKLYQKRGKENNEAQMSV